MIHLDLFFDSISFGELFSSIQDDKGLSHLRFSIKEESKQSILDYVPCIRSSLELHFGKLNFIQLCSLTSNLTLSVTVEDKWSDAKFHISYFNGFNHCIISNGSDMSILEEDYILTKLNFSYEFYKSYLSDREKFCLTSLLTLIESCPLSGIQKIKSLEGKVQFHLNQTEYLFNLRVLNCNFLTDFVIACLEVKSNGKRYFKYYSDFLDFDTGSMLSAVSKRRILKKLKPISKSQIDRLKDIIERDTFKYLIECEVLSILHEKHNYDKVDHLKRIINFL